MTKHRGGLTPDKYLTDEQLKKLRSYVKEQADLARHRGSKRAVTDELIIEILVNSGLRARELAGLTIGDLPMTHGKPCLWVRNGKGAIDRVVEIPQSLIKQLTRYIKLYRKKAEPTDPLFASRFGTPIHYRTLREKMVKLGKRAGMPGLHLHMLRHTYAVRLYNVEKDLRFVQDQLGHSSPTVTAIYAQTNAEGRKRQVQALDRPEE